MWVRACVYEVSSKMGVRKFERNEVDVIRE